MKDEVYDSDLIFKNTVVLSTETDTDSDTDSDTDTDTEEEEEEEITKLSGVEIYAYAPFVTLIDDKSDEAYSVASYEDAVAGVLTNDVSGASKQYAPVSIAVNYSSSYAGYEDALMLNVKGERVFIVAIDTENKGFAYNNYSVGLNLSKTYIALNWLAWRTGFYTQGGWKFYSSTDADADTDTDSTDIDTDDDE